MSSFFSTQFFECLKVGLQFTRMSDRTFHWLKLTWMLIHVNFNQWNVRLLIRANCKPTFKGGFTVRANERPDIPLVEIDATWILQYSSMLGFHIAGKVVRPRKSDIQLLYGKSYFLCRTMFSAIWKPSLKGYRNLHLQVTSNNRKIWPEAKKEDIPLAESDVLRHFRSIECHHFYFFDKTFYFVVATVYMYFVFITFFLFSWTLPEFLCRNGHRCSKQRGTESS